MQHTRSTAQLASQLRIVFCEMKEEHERGGGLSQQQCVHFARRYVAEMYYCVEQLQTEVGAAKVARSEDEHDLRTEMQRTLWSICVWELCVLMFVRRPLVLGEGLLLWWQAAPPRRHLCLIPLLPSKRPPAASDILLD